jgi:hypothetical protein
MKQILFVLIIICLSSFKAWPQLKELCRIKGRLIDKDTQQPLEGATVLLLSTKDSSQSASAFTEERGFFVLEALKEGQFKLHISYLGYQTMSYTLMIKKSDTLIDMSVISMQKAGVTLRMVEIVEVRPPVKIKKDTLEFDAGYYRIRENAMLDELLMKLPGVQIGDDGTVKVNGISVEKILVDGKPFFGNDTKLATRNLPINIIDKVQLIDDKSDKAQYVGSNNEKRRKTINITVKQNRKDNFIGSATLGIGTNDRFVGNVNLNQFGSKQQLSFLAGGNNINGYLDGEGRIRVSPGVANGITQNWNGGVNYNKDFNKALKISSSHLFNKDYTENQLNSIRQNLLPDTTYYYAQKANIANSFYKHSLNMRIEYNPDTVRSLIINTMFVYDCRNENYKNFYESSSEDRKVINSGTMHSANSTKSPHLDVGVLLARKFRKPGRNIGVGLDLALNRMNMERFNKSFSLFIRPDNSNYKDTIDQRSEIKNRYLYTQLSITYTEPVFKGHLLEFSHTYTWRKSTSIQFTYDYNVSKGRYDRLNDSLSNSFKNGSFTYLASISISAQKQKYSYSLGLNMLYNNINSGDINQYSGIQQRTTNFYPTAYFNYELNDNRRLSFDYGGGLQPPDVAQLQPVINNSNPLYMQQGNPSLKAAFTHNFSLSYSHFNPLKMSAFIVGVNGDFTSNKITNESWVDSLGRQLNKPVNVNGCYNLNVAMENTFPLTKQRTSIKTNTLLAFRQDVTYNNLMKVQAKGFNITQAVGFSWAYKKAFDFTTSARASYIGMLYSPQQNINSNYLTYALSISCNVNLPLGLTVSSSLDYKLNSNRIPGYNSAASLLNASLSKKVLRHKQALIRVQGLDLLKQNVGINRTINSNYIEDMQAMVMQRFFIVAFTYYLGQPRNNE